MKEPRSDPGGGLAGLREPCRVPCDGLGGLSNTSRVPGDGLGGLSKSGGVMGDRRVRGERSVEAVERVLMSTSMMSSSHPGRGEIFSAGRCEDPDQNTGEKIKHPTPVTNS